MVVDRAASCLVLSEPPFPCPPWRVSCAASFWGAPSTTYTRYPRSLYGAPALPALSSFTALLRGRRFAPFSRHRRPTVATPSPLCALIPIVVRDQLISQAEEVTIFNHFLHMHENGQRAITRQYRNDSSGNEVLVHSAEVEYYSFLQAGGFVVPTNESVTIQVGAGDEEEASKSL